MNNIVRAHIVIEGRVQGVGYRAFAHRNAIREGLSGWVQNLSNGRVELEVQGPHERIEVLLAVLRNGPSLAQVDQLHVNWVDAHQESEEFRVLHPW